MLAQIGKRRAQLKMLDKRHKIKFSDETISKIFLLDTVVFVICCVQCYPPGGHSVRSPCDLARFRASCLAGPQRVDKAPKFKNHCDAKSHRLIVVQQVTSDQ